MELFYHYLQSIIMDWGEYIRLYASHPEGLPSLESIRECTKMLLLSLELHLAASEKPGHQPTLHLSSTNSWSSKYPIGACPEGSAVPQEEPPESRAIQQGSSLVCCPVGASYSIGSSTSLSASCRREPLVRDEVPSPLQTKGQQHPPVIHPSSPRSLAKAQELLESVDSDGPLSKVERETLEGLLVSKRRKGPLDVECLGKVARLSHRQVKRLNKSRLSEEDKKVIKAMEFIKTST